MSEHRASVRWKRTSADFTYDTYNRAHEVTFNDGAIVVRGSAAPAFRGDVDRVQPEDAFVCSLSACHMRTVLAICARKHIFVDSYESAPGVHVVKNRTGKQRDPRVMSHRASHL